MLQSVSRSTAILRSPASSSPLPQALLSALKRETSAASTKKPAYPQSGSFDMIIKGGPQGVVPVSVNWAANGKTINGHLKIKGTVKYLVKGKVVSYALDQNHSFIKNGKIHFRSPVLKGEHVFETNVNTQKRKYEAIRKAILALIKNKGKAPPRLKGQFNSVKTLAANLYGALLSFGVDDIKYGRSSSAQRIREWLTIVTDPKRVGWGNASSAVSALHQLGLNAKLGQPFKVQLRPVERVARGRSLAVGIPYRPLLIAGLQDLRNILDAPMLEFNRQANAAYDRLRRTQQRPTAQQVYAEMRLTMHDVAVRLAATLAAPGVLTVGGINATGRTILALFIDQLWMGTAARGQIGPVAAMDGFIANMRGLLGANANHDAIVTLGNALRQAPFAAQNGSLNYIRNLITMREQDMWMNFDQFSSATAFFGDRKRGD